MKRRGLLQLAPAALAATAVPATALCIAVEESCILELFRRHEKLVDEAEAYPFTKEDLESPDFDTILDRLFYHEIFRIEDEMMALPSKPPADFAAKMIVATSRGRVFPDWDEGDIYKEARALVA